MNKKRTKSLINVIDIEILSILKNNKNSIPKTIIHNTINKHNNRINDSINKLKKYSLIIESQGEKRNSKVLSLNKDEINLISLLIKKFKKNQ